MIDEQLIGKKVGAGLQHTVFEYGADNVIKIPHLWMRFSTTFEQKQKELRIAQAYFTDYLPETTIIEYRDSYCYIQKKIEGLSPLTLSHLDTRKTDLSIFLRQNKKLIQEHGVSVDILGGKSYIHALSRHASQKPILSANVVVHETTLGKLYLLDTDLLRTSLFNINSPREILFVILSFGMYLLNTYTLKHYKIL